jgi:hypothetical protein
MKSIILSPLVRNLLLVTIFGLVYVGSRYHRSYTVLSSTCTHCSEHKPNPPYGSRIPAMLIEPRPDQPSINPGRKGVLPSGKTRHMTAGALHVKDPTSGY